MKVLANELQEMAPDVRQIGRWGGDEFVGVLSGELKDVVRTLGGLNRVVSAQSIQGKYFIMLSIGLCKISGQEASFILRLKKRQRMNIM